MTHFQLLKRTRGVLSVERKISEGGITVFLAMTLLVIMALLGTMVEVTRGKVCRVYGRRTLKTASDSLLTEYSRPLYEQYHLFFLENNGEALEKVIAEYAGNTLQGDSLFPNTMNLYDGMLQDVAVDELRYVGDEKAAALQEQITAYMRKCVAADVIEALLGKTKEMEGISSSAEKIDRKLQEEKDAADQSKKVLQLMEYIDGVDCSDGKVKGHTYFVKMFTHGKRQPERFGITEPAVWEIMEKNIVELQVYFSRLEKNEKIRQRFAELVNEVQKRTKKALKLAEEIGDCLQKGTSQEGIISVLNENLGILQETQLLLEADMTEQTVVRLKKIWKTYNTKGIVFNYEGIENKGGAESPMKSFKKALSGGVLGLVVEDVEELSKKAVKDADHYHRLYENVDEGGREVTNDLKEFASEETLHLEDSTKGLSGISAPDLWLYEYMKKYFSSWGVKSDEREKRLDYEWEYLLCGGSSDRENFEMVVNRLILMRMVINTTLILSSSSRRETAYAAALAVVGFTGMEPLIRFTQTLFLVLWGAVESLIDVAAILQNRAVPLLKRTDAIVAEFPDLYRVNNSYVMGKAKKYPKVSERDLGYQQYLMLLMPSVGREIICWRMMDLMEWNVRDQGFPGFSLGICVDAFRVTGSFTFATKFFRLPSIQDVLQRELREFHQSVTIDAKYIAS